MTIVSATGVGPTSNVGIAPIGGGGLKQIIISTALDIAETVITNYLTNKFSGKKVSNESKSYGSRKARGHSYKRYRARNSRYSKPQNARYRKRAKRPRWRKQQYSS